MFSWTICYGCITNQRISLGVSPELGWNIKILWVSEQSKKHHVYGQNFMVCVSLDWSEKGVDDLFLWGFVVKHTAWIHNCIPNGTSRITPLEHQNQGWSWRLTAFPCLGLSSVFLWSKIVWWQEIHNLNQGFQQGQFISYSDEHSTLVANVQHYSTRFVILNILWSLMICFRWCSVLEMVTPI